MADPHVPDPGPRIAGSPQTETVMIQLLDAAQGRVQASSWTLSTRGFGIFCAIDSVPRAPCQGKRAGMELSPSTSMPRGHAAPVEMNHYFGAMN